MAVGPACRRGELWLASNVDHENGTYGRKLEQKATLFQGKGATGCESVAMLGEIEKNG